MDRCLDKPAALAGLAAFKKFFDVGSRASKTTIETCPWPYEPYAQGKVASMIGSSWFSCCVGDKYKSVTKQFVMPSHTSGQPMPGFAGDRSRRPHRCRQGGSCRPGSPFTSTEFEKILQAKGNVLNATNLLGNSVNERAARKTWFVPTAKNWVNVRTGTSSEPCSPESSPAR